MTGRFIALEGGEAAGKSTQADRLAARLGAVRTREPGGTSLGAADRARLLHPLAGAVILFARNYETPAQLRIAAREGCAAIQGYLIGRPSRGYADAAAVRETVARSEAEEPGEPDLARAACG